MRKMSLLMLVILKPKAEGSPPFKKVKNKKERRFFTGCRM